MPAPVRTSRETWVKAGLWALAGGGPEAVRVDVLAKSLDTTRGSFYWHFKNRQALLDAMLDAWEHMGADEVIQQAETEGRDAKEKLRLLAASVPTGEGIPVDLAIRDWARRDPAVADRLRRVDNRRMGYLRKLFAEFCPDPADAEARSLLMFSLGIANQLLTAEHGRLSRAEVLDVAVRRLLD